ncbi:arsenate reductase ArsC [Hymenobacter metallilatus]|uniref:Arsenate reductase ArsC n=1 Tax=Hymenobacter metallilatus TaxID=2493666 RepID=A0A3R9MKE8_9BACT|nr:arsenate reductase ArsC [Hymenobacter metallilatus]RSK33914.1 arsenate reductase ArsC [Hymenobacter metallilatus]
MNILVLCTGNSCRSQMLHGYLHQLLPTAQVYSAGVETHGLNPRAVQVMAEDGIDISQHTSNLATEYAAVPFDVVVTVCDHARETCPVLPGAATATRLHHSFPDPARATGPEEVILESFRATRDQIRGYAQEFARTHVASPLAHGL